MQRDEFSQETGVCELADGVAGAYDICTCSGEKTGIANWPSRSVIRTLEKVFITEKKMALMHCILYCSELATRGEYPCSDFFTLLAGKS